MRGGCCGHAELERIGRAERAGGHAAGSCRCHRDRRRPQVAGGALLGAPGRRDRPCTRSSRANAAARSLGSAVKLRISHPELAPELVRALNDTDCLAARTGARHRRGVRALAARGRRTGACRRRAALLRQGLGRASPAVPGDAARRPLAPPVQDRRTDPLRSRPRPADKGSVGRHGHATGDEMAAGQLLLAFTLGTAALALWSYVRWPGAAPATMKGAALRVALAFVFLQVGAAALGFGVDAAPVLAVARPGRRRRTRVDVRVPRLDLVPEGLRRPGPRRLAAAVRPTRRTTAPPSSRGRA